MAAFQKHSHRPYSLSSPNSCSFLEVMKHMMANGAADLEAPDARAEATAAATASVRLPVEEVSLSLSDYITQVAAEEGLIFIPKPLGFSFGWFVGEELGGRNCWSKRWFDSIPSKDVLNGLMTWLSQPVEFRMLRAKNGSLAEETAAQWQADLSAWISYHPAREEPHPRGTQRRRWMEGRMFFC